MKIYYKTILASVLACGLTISAQAADDPTLNDIANPQDSNAASIPFTTEQEDQIQKIIHSYLVEHPEVLMEASLSLQKKQLEEQQKQAMKGIQDNLSQIFENNDNPYLGNKKGDILIAEFFDYQCGHCKIMSPAVETILKNNSNVKIVLKELPIFGGNSQLAAEASMAVFKQDQSQYASFHHNLLSEKEPLTEDSIMDTVKKAGLDTEKTKALMKDKSLTNQLRENFTLMRDINIQGTPFFIISNSDYSNIKILPGSGTADDLQKLIDAVENNA